MGFFTTDFGLGEEYANPKVSQTYQPSGGAGATSPALTSRQAASGPLGQLAQAMSGSTSGGYNWNQQQQGKGLSGLSDLIGGGGLGGGLGGIGGGGTVMPSPSFPEPRTFPKGALPPSGSYVSGGGEDSAQEYTGPKTLEEYLQSKEQTPSWLTTGARALIPGFSAMSSFADIGWGINPWYDTKVGGLFGAEPTFDWYKGDTDWVGRPASEKALGQQELRDLYTNFNFYKGSGMLPEGMDWGQFKASKGDIWGDKGMFGGVLNEAFAEQAAAAREAQAATRDYGVEGDATSRQNGQTFHNDNYNWGSTESHDNTLSAGGYTWDGDQGSVAEMQEETGLGTQEWDSNAEGFSWGEESWESDGQDTGDGYGDADSDAASDMDEDSGWSGADSDFSDSGGGDSGGGGGGSYIATAATQALGEEGLKLFEDWRDYMFTALPTFTTSYGRYRVTAPKIVEAIDKKDNSKNIYSWIWDMHLKPIFDMIVEDKDSEKALKDYKIMVKDLQNKFLKEKR